METSRNNVDVPWPKRWAVAVRPFAYTASVLAVALGEAIAWYSGYPVRWGPLVLTLLGVLSFHTGANLLNDTFDHRRGLDTELLPTSGAIVRGWLTETQVFRAAVTSLIVGALCGLVLVWYAGWVVLLLGVAGAICALGYTTPRFCFKYMGGGDAAIFLSFGVLTVFGTFWVQSGHFDWLPILWSIPLSMLTVGILHSNNWRDIERDGHAKCRTIAGFLGPSGSARYYRFLILGPYAFIALMALYRCLRGAPVSGPLTVLLAFLSLPLAIRVARISPERDPAAFAMLDGRTAQLHLVFGVLLTIAFVVGRWL